MTPLAWGPAPSPPHNPRGHGEALTPHTHVRPPPGNGTSCCLLGGEGRRCLAFPGPREPPPKPLDPDRAVVPMRPGSAKLGVGGEWQWPAEGAVSQKSPAKEHPNKALCVQLGFQVMGGIGGHRTSRSSEAVSSEPTATTPSVPTAPCLLSLLSISCPPCRYQLPDYCCLRFCSNHTTPLIQDPPWLPTASKQDPNL